MPQKKAIQGCTLPEKYCTGYPGFVNSLSLHEQIEKSEDNHVSQSLTGASATP